MRSSSNFEKNLHVEQLTVAAGNQYLFTAYRDCVVDLMISAPMSADVKTVDVLIDGMPCEVSLLHGSLWRLENVKLRHMDAIIVKHGTLNAGQPFTVRLAEVPL